MAESIVKVPSTASGDMDFLAFSFNGLHSWDDFGIYRVGDGDRYNENLSPTMTDKTAESPGGDGMYFFGTNHKQKDFNINFAFDHLTDSQVREMKRWLNGKEMGDLWFEEAPYKVWTAKVTGQPSIKYIPFDDFDEQGNKIRVYRGEGSVVFTAYWPYAHTPEAVWTLGGEVIDGKSLLAYADFANKEQWTVASGLAETETPNLVAGDLPTHFTASLTPYELAELVYEDELTKANCIGYKTAANTNSRLLVRPGAETTTLTHSVGADYITWNAKGTYTDNPLRNLFAIDLSQTNITEIPNYCFSISQNAPYKDNLLENIKLPPNLEDLGDMFLSSSIINKRAQDSKEDTYITSNGVEKDRGQTIQGKSKTLYKMGSINIEKESFVIQEGTKFLGSYCCHESKAKSVFIPEGVLRIGAGAFQDCSQLKKVYLPKTVHTISKWAFNNTPSDLLVYYAGTKTDFDKITTTMDGQDSGVKGKTIICSDGTLNSNSASISN